VPALVGVDQVRGRRYRRYRRADRGPTSGHACGFENDLSNALTRTNSQATGRLAFAHG
jgi:hypothetical protein